MLDKIINYFTGYQSKKYYDDLIKKMPEHKEKYTKEKKQYTNFKTLCNLTDIVAIGVFYKFPLLGTTMLGASEAIRYHYHNVIDGCKQVQHSLDYSTNISEKINTILNDENFKLEIPPENLEKVIEVVTDYKNKMDKRKGIKN